MTDPGVPPIFLVHLMKTGGTSLKTRLLATFPEESVYPNRHDDRNQMKANVNIQYLLDVEPERHERTRAYAGHVPFFVTESLGIDLHTVSVLRDPVGRVISHLKQVRREQAPWTLEKLGLTEWNDPSFETLYDNAYLHDHFFSNYQTRLFSLTPDDGAVDHLHLIDIDAQRLRLAKEHLNRVDVVGVMENLDQVVEQLHFTHGISTDPIPKMLVSTEDWTLDPALIERIKADNRFDAELHEFARELILDRASSS